MVGAIGFEPTTSWSQTRRSTRLSYTPPSDEAWDALTPSQVSMAGFQKHVKPRVTARPGKGLCAAQIGGSKVLINASCLTAWKPPVYTSPQSLKQMDTLSRDSNSSGSVLPLVGVIAGGLALVLSIVALVKLSTPPKDRGEHTMRRSPASSPPSRLPMSAACGQGPRPTSRACAPESRPPSTRSATRSAPSTPSSPRWRRPMKKPAPPLRLARAARLAAPTGVARSNANGNYVGGQGRLPRRSIAQASSA